jgi:hypothetical protein
MLALYRGSRQVVVTHKILDGADVIGEWLGKRPRPADQLGHALSQRVVDPFDVIGLTG